MRLFGMLLVGVGALVALSAILELDLGAGPTVAETADAGSPFVGADVCASCHRDEAERWAASSHGQHGVPRATPTSGADLSIGSKWMQAYMRRDETGRYRIHPLCFDLETQEWRSVLTILEAIRGDPGVGTERPPLEFEHRSFETDCAGCHTSGAIVRLDPKSQRMDARWRDVALDCETCHGPGRAHSVAWQALDASQPMVRLETLSARTRTAVCARCHGGPPTASDFGPDDAEHFLAAAPSLGGLYSSGAAAGQVYQADAFLRSPCHVRGNLSCADCHDPHGSGLRVSGDSMCTSCHEEQATRRHTHHEPKGEGARCVSCHMPRLLEGALAHQRDHRIGVPRPYQHAPDACTSCHDEDKAWAARWTETWWRAPDHAVLEATEGIHLARTGEIARAGPILERALRLRDPFFKRTAMALLERPEAGIDDPNPEVRLEAVLLASSAAGTDDVLRRALDDEEPTIRARAWVELFVRGEVDGPLPVSDLRVTARHARDSTWAHLLFALSEIEAGAPGRAIRWLEETVVLRRAPDPVWIALVVAYDGVGRVADAAAIMRRWSPPASAMRRLEPVLRMWRRAGCHAAVASALRVVGEHVASDGARPSPRGRSSNGRSGS